MHPHRLYRGPRNVVQQYERLLAEQGITSTTNQSTDMTYYKTAGTAQCELFVDAQDLERSRSIVQIAEGTHAEHVEKLGHTFVHQFLIALAINTLIGVALWMIIGNSNNLFLLVFPGLLVTLAIVSHWKR